MKFFDDLPDIQLKAHAQAKHLKLVVSQTGIRLTYPPRTSAHLIQQFLQRSYPWLQQTWQKQQLQQPQNDVQRVLPTTLNLAYQPHTYQILYQEQAKKYNLDEAENTLYISSKSVEKYLTEFVISQAKLILPQQLMVFAQQHQCRISKIRLATPKTRWGSCSAQQEIMLHAGLVLMPQSYADYVLLHELAHTKQMNHQPAFWQVLDSFLPQSKQVQTQVKKFRLPFWWQPK